MRLLSPTLLLIFLSTIASAQFSPNPTGANRAEVDWQEIETEHFRIIYHTGLDSYAREAAAVAEAVFPVVTGNLRTPVAYRIPLYLSDLDAIPNAFAMGERYMHIWMRGILDDMPLGGIRSAGSAKWFRAVITHELTHVVIAHATLTAPHKWYGIGAVPRWFNEGTARFMEPDGWTSDVDAVLRVAAINGRLGYNALGSGRLDGTLLYETGHSIVRYMVSRWGDSVIGKILHGGKEGFGFDFESAVREATGFSMSEIYSDWFRTVTTLYGAESSVREEIAEISPAIGEFFEVVTGVRYAPARRRLAVLGAMRGHPSNLYLLENRGTGSPLDTINQVSLLSRESGFDEQFSWNPAGTTLVLSKLRYGSHSALVHDLYLLDVDRGSISRLTNNASLTDPEWSPDGKQIVAVEKRIGRDNLVLVDPSNGSRRALTRFEDDTQIYTPSWSPDGSRIAFSMFDPEGKRVIATIGADGTGLKRLTEDSLNNRYPLWSPDGSKIAFTSHAGGGPNMQIMDTTGGSRAQVTDLATGAFGVQWIPNSDSLLVISFDTRDRILPHLVPASRRVTLAAAPPVRERFKSWRDAAFPLQVPPAAAIAPATILDSSGHSPLFDIFPVAPVIPLLATDITREGESGAPRIGLASIWSDPMEIHSGVLYADYGFKSKEPGAELLYFYRGLPFTLQLHLAYSLGFAGTIGDLAYYQRDRTIALSASYELPDPNTFGIGSLGGIGVRRRTLEPYNGGQYRNAGLDSGRIPENARLSELLAFYEFNAPSTHVRGEVLRSEPALGSDREYTRLGLRVSYRSAPSPVWFFGSPTYLINVDVAAHYGDQVAQEALAFQAHDHFENGFSLQNLVALSSNRTSYRHRGVREYQSGSFLFLTSFGYIWQPEWIGALLPIVGAFSPDLIIYTELGGVKNDESTFGGSAHMSLGTELRTALPLNTWLSVGLASSPSQNDYDVYLRFSTGR